MGDIKVDRLTGLRFIDVRSNPEPDPVYDYLAAFDGVKVSHDGNTEDWKQTGARSRTLFRKICGQEAPKLG